MLARLADGWSDQHKLDGRLAVARDDDLFPALSRGDEFGEIGLRVMDIYFHTVILAKKVS